MAACFTPTANLTAYSHLENMVPLDELNLSAANLTGKARKLALQSEKLDWSGEDRADAGVVARADWYSLKPRVPFPSALYSAPSKSGSDSETEPNGHKED